MKETERERQFCMITIKSISQECPGKILCFENNLKGLHCRGNFKRPGLQIYNAAL